MRIELTRGYSAVVDESDFESLSRWKWHVKIKANGKVYAHRNVSSSVTKSGRTKRMMHVELLGKREGYVIDHADNDGLNNRRSNLKFVTKSENGKTWRNGDDVKLGETDKNKAVATGR